MNDNLNKLLNGLKVLKDRHFYKEVVVELEKLYKSFEFKKYDKSIQIKILRLLSESIYQDKELPSSIRFDNSLNYLDELEESAETLCLKGAVYKRKYQLHRNILDIYKAISLYEKAALEYSFKHNSDEKIDQDDQGYGAVNAIYLYKLLLKDFDKDLDKNLKEQYKIKYKQIIDNTINHMEKYKQLFSKKNPWVYPTLSELYLNKKEYDIAKNYLVYDTVTDDIKKLQELKQLTDLEDKTKKAIDYAILIKSEGREKLIIMEQFIRLYKIEGKMEDGDKEILEKLFENFIDDKKKIKNIVHSTLVGKIGIALSGGGFRASLFHLGVFARLAEINMLKDISVISSVSGGSIIAMHYYIKLKRLLETKENNTIVQEDYISLVKEIQKEFLEGIQTNIRMKAFVEYTPSCETITQRLGKLYQEEFFNKVSKESTPQKMKDLYIFPKINTSQLDNFNPHFNNLELNSKVPILAINATCLNNGHNWRFTASGMGESQYMYDTTIDKNMVHKYTRYDEFKDNKFKNFRISDAVASSSCVPGLFDPIELENAYKDKEVIKLIDGGVYDNQGLATLLDEECDLIICSDASGQFSDEADPSSCRPSIISRINKALMDRGRDQGYKILKDSLKSKKVQGICIVHLKQCFTTQECLPKNRCEPVKQNSLCTQANLYATNIDEELQNILSNVRTDLDAFSDMEAYALQYSGYIIISKWFESIKTEQKIWQIYTPTLTSNWDFLKIVSIINNDRDALLKQLKYSKNLFFKYNPLKNSINCKISFLLAFLLLLWIVCKYFMLISIVLIVCISLFIGNKKLLYKLLKYAMKPILWIVGKYNLKCLNSKYLEEGKI